MATLSEQWASVLSSPTNWGDFEAFCGGQAYFWRAAENFRTKAGGSVTEARRLREAYAAEIPRDCLVAIDAQLAEGVAPPGIFAAAQASALKVMLQQLPTFARSSSGVRARAALLSPERRAAGAAEAQGGNNGRRDAALTDPQDDDDGEVAATKAELRRMQRARAGSPVPDAQRAPPVKHMGQQSTCSSSSSFSNNDAAPPRAPPTPARAAVPPPHPNMAAIMLPSEASSPCSSPTSRTPPGRLLSPRWLPAAQNDVGPAVPAAAMLPQPSAAMLPSKQASSWWDAGSSEDEDDNEDGAETNDNEGADDEDDEEDEEEEAGEDGYTPSELESAADAASEAPEPLTATRRSLKLTRVAAEPPLAGTRPRCMASAAATGTQAARGLRAPWQHMVEQAEHVQAAAISIQKTVRGRGVRRRPRGKLEGLPHRWPTPRAARPLPPDESPPATDEALLSAAMAWSFDIHGVAATDLPALCFALIMSHEAVQTMLPHPSRAKLWRYTRAVAAHYLGNPFHSFRHAADVTHGVSCLARWVMREHPGLLSELQLLALLLSAMVHDVDHPGVMNGFLVATEHPLASRYDGRSVLEKHHLATALALLDVPETDFAASALPPARQAEFRQAMGDLVLATDVTTHLQFMKDFEMSVAQQRVSALQAMKVMMKAADISNPTRPLPVYAKWVGGVMREFFAQGDAERVLGLPISMNCDRHSVDANKCQVGFISFIVAPIFSGLAAFVPCVRDECVPSLEANRLHYAAAADEVAQLQKARHAAAIGVQRVARGWRQRKSLSKPQVQLMGLPHGWPTPRAARPLPPDESPPATDEALLSAAMAWSFDIHGVAATDLPALCFALIMSHEAVQTMLPHPSRAKLWRYTRAVAAHYLGNPFHSFRHAADVTHGVSCLARWVMREHPGLLSELQLLALLLSAMVHDVDHPGVMNGFLVATEHPLASRYDGRSVLEKHHLATALALLDVPETDFAASALPPARQAEFRQAMGDLVLATDVTTHLQFMKDFEMSVAQQRVSALQAMKVMMKAADISNPTRPLPVYAKWVGGVMREFFAQGDAERVLGLPISMNCDRHSVDANKCQVGFISFIVAPIFSGLAAFVPCVRDECVPSLEANRLHYAAAADEVAQDAAVMAAPAAAPAAATSPASVANADDRSVGGGSAQAVASLVLRASASTVAAAATPTLPRYPSRAASVYGEATEEAEAAYRELEHAARDGAPLGASKQEALLAMATAALPPGSIPAASPAPTAATATLLLAGDEAALGEAVASWLDEQAERRERHAALAAHEVGGAHNDDGGSISGSFHTRRRAGLGSFSRSMAFDLPYLRTADPEPSRENRREEVTSNFSQPFELLQIEASLHLGMGSSLLETLAVQAQRDPLVAERMAGELGRMQGELQLEAQKASLLALKGDDHYSRRGLFRAHKPQDEYPPVGGGVGVAGGGGVGSVGSVGSGYATEGSRASHRRLSGDCSAGSMSSTGSVSTSAGSRRKSFKARRKSFSVMVEPTSMSRTSATYDEVQQLELGGMSGGTMGNRGTSPSPSRRPSVPEATGALSGYPDSTAADPASVPPSSTRWMASQPTAGIAGVGGGQGTPPPLSPPETKRALGPSSTETARRSRGADGRSLSGPGAFAVQSPSDFITRQSRQSEPPPLHSNEHSFKKCSGDGQSFTKRLMRRSSSGTSSTFRPKSRSPLSLRPQDAPYDLGQLGSIGSQRCSSGSVQDHHLQV